ncbi:MAG: hypothetical protein GVY11_06095 [Gammaproteobacteria bacterium]|jgi:hypothetical protein|nr:hypothetical protein [Gammaproteobacteria bacterium]
MPEPKARTGSVTPRLRRALLLLPAVVALWIAASEFAHLRWLDRDEPAASIDSMRITQPWGGLAGKEGARLLETRWRLNADTARSALEWQLGHYPLSPWRWLLFTHIAVADGADEQGLTNLLATAISVQPHSPTVRWEAANLAQRTGRASLVFRQLRLLLEVQPNATDRALFIGSRWSDDPGALIDQVLPPGREYLQQAMRRARRSGSMPLAEAVWARYTAGSDTTVPPDDPAFADYLYLAVRHDDARAMAAWQAVDAGYRPGDLPAGDFSWPLEVLPSFGWSLRTPEGVRLERVAIGADGEIHGLAVAFSGEHNVRLNQPAVRFPSAGPGFYRLRGWWRAEGLTTRALPYLELRTQSGEQRTRRRVEVPAPEFGWTPFSIDYEIQEAGQDVVLRLRRDTTDAFDRYIEGRIVLAGLGVTSLLPSTGQAPAPEAWARVRDRVAPDGGDCPGDGSEAGANDNCREASRP